MSKPKHSGKNLIDKALNEDINAVHSTLKIILIYLIMGIVWIIGSDILIELIFQDHDAHRIIQSIKGGFYVVFTAVIFYLIIHRQMAMFVMTIVNLRRAYIELDEGHKKSLQLEDQLYDLAYYDPLTGLPNRILLEQTITSYMQQHPEDGMIGIVYFDIDEFRNINEVKGHIVGDELIKQISSSLSEHIKKPNILSRISGDEFVLALFDIVKLEDFLTTIETYISYIRKGYTLENDTFFVTFSSGVALYPDHGSDYITLLRHADAAMSIAKAKGKDQIVIFDDEMVSVVRQQTELLNQLRVAIENNEFQLYYQPIIELETGKTIGTEALIRWIHPTKGFIPPLEFIALSEKNGFIKEITEWVFKEAAEQFGNWGKKRQFIVSINLSASMLMNDKFINDLIRWIDEYHIDCQRFNIEITETAIIDDIDKSIHVLNALKRLGFTIALDDFGTGYSSLTYLQKLPIDTIKIDRSFISNIKEDTEEFYVLRYMIELAHHLKLSVIAEGIETKEQAEMIKKYEVDYAQGYYYCKPMPQSRVIEYIKTIQKEGTGR
ncbi:MAG: EAL domain-containing protein [Acholeplasmataceae bacterium]|jgi:diguanylate cyclase (GGDEF)-like protein|nr:EAL domain-containing protein [Acholeplasmataceae bacterium]